MVLNSSEYKLPKLTRVQTYVYRFPLATPVVTSFGEMHDRPAVIVRVEDSDGAYGWGEIWCNFPSCGAEHRARLVDTVVAGKILGQDCADPAAVFRRLTTELHVLGLQTAEFGPIAQVLAGVDIALWDLAARRNKLPIRKLLQATARDTVPVYASGIHASTMEQTVAAARDAGYRAYKLKVGFGAAKDMNATRRLRELLGSNERMMLDANQAWDLPSAIDMVRQLGEFQPDWLEEPLAADAPVDAWRALKHASAIPLAAGENMRSDAEFSAAIACGVFSVVQPDMCKWGGFTACHPVALRVLAADLKYCPHYLGAGIGLMASAQLLAAAGGSGLLEVDCNPNPLRELLAHPYPSVVDGSMRLPDNAGLGIEPQLEQATQWLCYTTTATPD